MRRVAIKECLATDGWRQDADGQHRIGWYHRGGATVGRRGVRTTAPVRVVQHSSSGVKEHPDAGNLYTINHAFRLSYQSQQKWTFEIL